MKITIVSPVFPPEPIVSARTSADLARQLAALGNSVLVITAFPNRPGGVLYPGYRRAAWNLVHDPAGFDLLRCLSAFSTRSSLSSRFWENFTFGVASALAVLFMPRPDVLYANTWPLIAQGLLSLVCRLRRIPVVLSIQDIYPESLLSQNRMQPGRSLLFRLMRWMDEQTARNSAALAVIAEQFRDLYIQDRHVAPGRVHVVPNWIDENEVTLDPQPNPIRARHGIPPGAFLLAFAGNIGVAAGVEMVIRAFEDLKAQEQLYLLIAGAGSQLAACVALAQQTGNTRILFHSPWPTEETSTLLACADVCILPTIGEQATVSVPSKLIFYMLAGRPVVACVAEKSPTAGILRQADCGWVLPPNDPHALADLLLAISEHPLQELRARGARARGFALANMTQAIHLPRLVQLVLAAANPANDPADRSIGAR